MIPQKTLSSKLRRNLIYVSPHTPVIEVINTMTQNKISCVLVVENLRLQGIFTERDVVKLIAAKVDFQGMTIAALMTRDVICISEAETNNVLTVLQWFRQYHIRHLPVVNEQGEIVNIMTPSSIRERLHPSDLLKLRLISETMTTEVLNASPTISVLELTRIMNVNKVSCIVITDSNIKPIGIVTERDIVKLRSQNIDFKTTSAETIMSRPLIPVYPDDSLWSAHQQMQANGIRRLVVIGEDGQLLGIITQTDIIRALDPLEMHNIITVLKHTIDEKTTELEQEISRSQELIESLKTSETRYRDSETKLNDILDSAISVISSFKVFPNRDWEYEYYSNGSEKIFGYTAEELCADKYLWWSRVLPEDIENVIIPCYDNIFAEKNSIIEYRFLHKDGKIHWLLSQLASRRDEANDCWVVTVVNTDITESKQREEALRIQAEHERLINQISEQIRQSLDIKEILNNTVTTVRNLIVADRVIVYRFNSDWSGNIIAESVALGWISLFGENSEVSSLTAESVLDSRCKINLSGDNKTLIEDSYLQQNKGGLYNQGLKYLCVNDIYQEGFADCYIKLLERFQARAYITVPILQKTKLWGLLATYQNATPRQWTETEINVLCNVASQLGVALHQAEQAEQLKLAKEQAEAANRSKSTFLTNMSHELRTPLNAILGFSQLLTNDTNLTSDQKENLEIISRSGQHLLGLINDILDMSKIEAGRVTLNETTFNLYSLLDNLEEMFSLQARTKQISLIVEKTIAVPQYIKTDEAKLRQVLINLLSNAFKFTQQGTITLTVRAENQNTGITRLFFVVQDTGVGIPSEDLDNIFMPFMQTSQGKKSNQGTGLGLTISRFFVELMGGHITVSSTVGVGTTFSFDIAVCESQEIESLNQQPSQQIVGLPPDSPKYRILIVDDLESNSKLLESFLAAVGFETRLAENGIEAIALWQSWQPNLICMDLRMPLLDGYEATKQIRYLENLASRSRTIIIALSASAFSQDREQAIAVGCDAFLDKPITREKLLATIAQKLGINYIYQETVKSVNNISTDLIDLSVMPQTWRDELTHAATEADDLQLLKLIEEIPSSHQQLKDALKSIVNNFNFDIVIKIAQ